MNGYHEFVEKLNEHLRSYPLIENDLWAKDGLRFINGLAADELRRLVNLDVRREYGAFFTDSEMAYDLITNSNLKFPEHCICYDPAVGAGNLLIAAFKALMGKAKELTLLGTDLHQEFVQAAHLRLQITGLMAGKESVTCQLSVSDGLQNNEYYTKATHILTNPPFNLIDGDDTINWGKGKLSAAAVFIDRIIRFVSAGTPIVAILPDVLRSGSRYEKWRKMIEKTCIVSSVKMLGQFDKYADIDVFSVVLIKKQFPEDVVEKNVWAMASGTEQIISHMFDVSVGNVVDNRDAHEGIQRPFLVSRGLTGWQVVHQVSRRRQFKGPAISSPFVVVKRTSRMGDKHRATATIINVKEPVFVDNHLIILKPKSGKMKDCFNLISKLQLNTTDNWINEQIRCRHLTVKIVSRIPL